MQEAIPSALSHVSLGTSDFSRAVSFYDRVLASLGIRRLMIHEGAAAAYGRQFPEFWVQIPYDQEAPSVGNGTHFAFYATSREQVRAFYAAALEAGATPDGEPGERSEYGAPYYGAFVRDLDGHKIEATFWDLSKA